jgi:hypothetical protein
LALVALILLTSSGFYFPCHDSTPLPSYLAEAA